MWDHCCLYGSGRAGHNRLTDEHTQIIFICAVHIQQRMPEKHTSGAKQMGLPGHSLGQSHIILPCRHLPQPRTSLPTRRTRKTLKLYYGHGSACRQWRAPLFYRLRFQQQVIKLPAASFINLSDDNAAYTKNLLVRRHALKCLVLSHACLAYARLHPQPTSRCNSRSPYVSPPATDTGMLARTKPHSNEIGPTMPRQRHSC
ncbi:hypothetical protein BDW22DRAFT_753921 [Trametopsis cervina]|nr:hypothetical protein BDW22DRAFT_753921 [Trametopsis cervina]